MSIEILKAEVVKLETEIAKFQEGNQSAGGAARKTLQTIKKVAQDLRIAVQAERKTRWDAAKAAKAAKKAEKK